MSYYSQTCPYGPFHNKETSLSWTCAVLLAPKTYMRTALFSVPFRVGVHIRGAWLYWLTYSYYNHPSADPCLLCMPLVTTSVLRVTTLMFNLSRGKRSFKPYQNEHDSVKWRKHLRQKPFKIDKNIFYEKLVPLPSCTSFMYSNISSCLL